LGSVAWRRRGAEGGSDFGVAAWRRGRGGGGGGERTTARSMDFARTRGGQHGKLSGSFGWTGGVEEGDDGFIVWAESMGQVPRVAH
jgi:hypothetical protein